MKHSFRLLIDVFRAYGFDTPRYRTPFSFDNPFDLKRDAQGSVGTMYMDKLDGRITQDFFDKHSATLRLQQNSLLRKIQEVERATPASMDQAIDLLQLMSRAAELFLEQPAPPSTALCQLGD